MLEHVNGKVDYSPVEVPLGKVEPREHLLQLIWTMFSKHVQDS
jgi:hypothetical protein